MDPAASVPIDPALLTPSELLASTRNVDAPQRDLPVPTRTLKDKLANLPQHDSYAAYEVAGKKMACLINPGFSPLTALRVGLKDSRNQWDEIPLERSEVDRYLIIYYQMLRYVPWLHEELRIMDTREFEKVASKITTGMSLQHSMDLGSVKHAGLAYIPLDMHGTFALNPPLLKGEDKSDRGFNHPQLAELLCPRKKLDLFKKDPAGTMTALQTGAIDVTTWNWPTFFYEDGLYDPQNRHHGLFHGHIAWRFYVHLFIGPSAAAKGVVTSNASKKAKNRAWGLTEVTPHIIAYVHVIAYFTLSAEQKWTNTTGNIDLAEMAWYIVDMFEDRDDWTRETLAWWNSRAFPERSRNGSKALKRRIEPDSDDNVVHIRATRGSTVSSNPSSSLGGGSDVNNNASCSNGISSAGSSDNAGFDFSAITTENRGTSPLTSDEEDSEELVAPVPRRAKPKLKKRKKADEDIFITDTEDRAPASATLEIAKATTCAGKPRGRAGKKRANGF
ncbi:hypothetical protein M404DRAFT_31121 [Pisolithus tinctorius Marx 270]|uniref:Uncharacterized protein n=1 Tax=Pisolithus tinctorius Marx 270 TaxID=870435 RepID=A0A0C3NCE6_PISTI|nr:hypothetical protein M404DRAFT_31121 [Pisolithus tinctorius Marx 270]